MRKIIIILDGLADQINTKTSLELAKTPNLDKLAQNSLCGLMYPIKDIAPESGAAQFVILGQDLNKYPGRGIIEALGANIKIKPNHTYLRVNFAKIKNNRLINIREPIPKNINQLNKINKNIKIYQTKGYRAILEIKGKHKINNTHPGYKTYQNLSTAVKGKLKEIQCNNKLVNNYIKQVKKILKNKTILVRGSSYKLPKLKPLKNWSIIAEMPVEIGLRKLLGMKIIKHMTYYKVFFKYLQLVSFAEQTTKPKIKSANNTYPTWNKNSSYIKPMAITKHDYQQKLISAL